MGQITIPGASGPETVVVSGAQTLAFAENFARLVHADSTFVNLSTGVTTTVAGGGHILYSVTASDTVVSIPTVSAAPHAVFVDARGPTTVVGSGTGDSVLATGIDAALTYYDKGGNNAVGFVTGNNLYVGDTTPGAGRDTIVAGVGADTIRTGYGAALVESGTGNAQITLNDTSGSAGDTVYMETGHGTLMADGARDRVFAGGAGQVIFGGADTAASVAIAINAGGGDTIQGGGATVSIYDGVGGSIIHGGSGSLYFVAQGAIADTIAGGTGKASVSGAAGSALTFTVAAQGSGYYLAGAGSETLAGGGAAGALYLFANNDTDTASAATNSLLVGGSGNDYIFSGDGNETLTGGAGQNQFVINAPADSVAAHILISDFGASSGDVAAFGTGYTPQEIQTALQGMHTVSGSFGTGVEIQFGDGTTVVFAGVSTLNGHVV